MADPIASVLALVAALEAGDPAMAIDPDEALCLAQNIYFEARSERPIGQIAVAHVTLNRVAHEDFPDTICEVVWDDRQFSWTHDGKSDVPKNAAAWDRAVTFAVWVLTDTFEDPTLGAVFYFNPELAQPSWRLAFAETAEIDNHLFLKEPTDE